MNKIKQLRKQKRLTQIELANIIKTSQRNISNWENNKFEPDNGTLNHIADFFGVTTDYLLGREPDSGLVYVHKDPALTDEEKHVLELYRNIIPESRDLTLSLMEQMPKIKADNNQSKKDV